MSETPVRAAPRYARNTLAEFSSPVSPELVEDIIERTFGARSFVDRTPFERHAGYIFNLHLGLPVEEVSRMWGDFEHGSRAEQAAKLATEINSWLANAARLEHYTAICDALLGRTESTESDARWEQGYARQVTRVFSVSEDIGRTFFHTPAKRGTRWGYLAAEATAKAILAATSPKKDPVPWAN